MRFKENLLKKISLDRKRQAVLSSLGPCSGIVRVDKSSMRYLLENAGMKHIRPRNIDVFIPAGFSESEKNLLFVLDNELGIYNTTIKDLLIRKEPTLKEMISIRNAIRILNDNDVVVSKKEASIDRVYKLCMDALDLSFSAGDIKQLEYEGRAAVEWSDGKAIKETIVVFSELLGLSAAPKALWVENVEIFAVKSYGMNEEELYGPFLIYGLTDDTLKLVTEKVNLKNSAELAMIIDIAKGGRPPSIEGPSVIKYLADEVIGKHDAV